MNSLVRLRTLDEAYAELKQLDPDTCISKYYIRRLALSGEIPVVMCGRKRLINLDALIDYLSSADNAAAVPLIGDGIRRIV